MAHRCSFIQVLLCYMCLYYWYMDWYGIEFTTPGSEAINVQCILYSCIKIHTKHFNMDLHVISYVRFIRTELPYDSSEREAPPKGQTALTLLYSSKALRDAYGSIFNLYEKFCGPIHLRALSNFLGYQGTAMLLEELMNVVENQVATLSSSSSSSSSSCGVYDMLYLT